MPHNPPPISNHRPVGDAAKNSEVLEIKSDGKVKTIDPAKPDSVIKPTGSQKALKTRTKSNNTNEKIVPAPNKHAINTKGAGSGNNK